MYPFIHVQFVCKQPAFQAQSDLWDCRDEQENQRFRITSSLQFLIFINRITLRICEQTFFLILEKPRLFQMQLGKFFGWYRESPPLELIFNRGIIWDYLCSLNLKCKLVTYSNYQIPDGHLLQHLANWKLLLLCSLIAQFQAWTLPLHLVVCYYPAINSAKGLRTVGVWRQFNAWVILFLLMVPLLPLSCQTKPLG